MSYEQPNGTEHVQLSGEVDPALLEKALSGAYELFPDIIRADTDRLTYEEIERFSKLEPVQWGRIDFCNEASEAFTRSAQSLGMEVHTEMHIAHTVTRLGSPHKKLSADDLIVDLTWGQFNHALYDKSVQDGSPRPFIGRRKDIRKLLPSGSRGAFLYGVGYAPASALVSEAFGPDGPNREPFGNMRKYRAGRLGQRILAATYSYNPYLK